MGLLLPQDGDLELQQGYLPQLGSPTGTKLRRLETEKSELVLQWLSERGDTTIRGLHTLRIKETDRLHALETEIRRLGGCAYAVLG